MLYKKLILKGLYIYSNYTLSATILKGLYVSFYIPEKDS